MLTVPSQRSPQWDIKITTNLHQPRLLTAEQTRLGPLSWLGYLAYLAEAPGILNPETGPHLHSRPPPVSSEPSKLQAQVAPAKQQLPQSRFFSPGEKWWPLMNAVGSCFRPENFHFCSGPKSTRLRPVLSSVLSVAGTHNFGCSSPFPFPYCWPQWYWMPGDIYMPSLLCYTLNLKSVPLASYLRGFLTEQVQDRDKTCIVTQKNSREQHILKDFCSKGAVLL